MSPRYLLDTNILSDLVRNPQGSVFKKISKAGEEHIFTSILVASELRFGACKKASKALTERVETILSNIEVLAYDEPADQHYAAIRAYLEKNGTPIGPNDLLIAAHARAANSILVTANTSEFSRVPELNIENWICKIKEY